MAATLAGMREGLASGDLSPTALARVSLDRIARLDGALGAVAATAPDLTLQAARAAEARLAAGERGPVLGIPVVLKDNLHWTGAPLACGSRVLEGYRAPYDATVVRRLLAAGAVPVAKAAMDEFAMGSSGEYCAYGPTRNPWDTTRVPGGSSSGSAVSVAARYAPLALGSDTGGSVRLPGAFCNVTALRPTYGVLSRFGVTAMASSLDQVGPLAGSAEDLAAALHVMAGRDPLDANSVDLPRSEALWPLAPADLRGLRVGLPQEYFADGIDPDARRVLDQALEVFRAAGAHLVPVTLPHTRYAIDTYYLVCTAEVSSNLSRFDGVRYGHREAGAALSEMISDTRDAGFGPEAKRRILLGTFCLSRGYYDAYYLRAQQARTLIRRDFETAFAEVDVLATPVSPGLPFPLGAKTADPLAMYLADVFTVPTALAGLPCLSMPAGFAHGLPIGLQLIGPALADVRILEVAHAFQQCTDHHLQSPALSQGAPHGL